MLVVDGEFSGLNYEKHSIVSWGALDLENPQNYFYAECRVWDGAHIDPDALAVNGFTEAEVRNPDKMSEAELVRNFTDWSRTIHNRTLAGQNVSADRDMLKAATNRSSYDWGFAHRTIDTHSLC